MPRRAAVLLAVALSLAACTSAPGGTPWPLPDDDGALRWGDGPYGLVLVPDAGRDAASWDAPARTFAEHGMTVVALGPDADAGRIAAAIEALQSDGFERVALLAAGAGSGPALELGSARPDLIDQLIVLSARGQVDGLGPFPKLFVASEDEALAAEAARMADAAPGDWNALYVAGGDESGQAILSGDGADAAIEAILLRLEERR